MEEESGRPHLPLCQPENLKSIQSISTQPTKCTRRAIFDYKELSLSLLLVTQVYYYLNLSPSPPS